MNDVQDHQPSDVSLVRAGHVLTMGEPGDIRNGAVAMSAASGTIVDVGPLEAIRAAYPAAEVVGDDHGIVTPGFVNAHDHLSEGLISGLAETMNLYEWQRRLISPVGPHLTRDSARIGTLLKGAEMLLSGITCVNDMFVHANPGSLASLGVVDGLENLGLRGVVSFGAHDRWVQIPVQTLVEEHDALADRAREARGIRFRLGIGTIHGQSDALLAASVKAARENGWPVHTHLAEVREEITEARIRYGTNTLGRGHEFGLLDLDVLYAHCVWVTEPDISALASHHGSVSYNPLANMILASGVCPVPRIRAAGIPVGLGTDGAASNDSHDMLQVLKCAALLQKVHNLDPAALTARDVLRMGTIEGAQALGLDDSIGSLEIGKQADLVRFSGQSPRLAYVHDPYQQLVYCAAPADVADVWIGGRPVVTGGRLCTVDETSIVEIARRAADQLFQVAGLDALTRYELTPARANSAVAADWMV